jgi:hypothetical protein
MNTNESGELQIPAGVLGAGPEDLTPEERVRSFHDWVARLPKRKGPPISAEALRRENLYD